MLAKPSFDKDLSNSNPKQQTTSNSMTTRKTSAGISKTSEKQSKSLDKKIDDTTELVRSKFNTKEFISNYSILRIIAANFFQVKFNQFCLIFCLD